jgi:hypothetical protein
MNRSTLCSVLSLCASATLHAQAAVIDGVVTRAQDSSAIAHALVRLQSPDGNTWTVKQQHITNSSGRFYFPQLAAGSYRVQLLRIGYEPVISETVRVSESGTTHVALEAPSRPVVLATMNVYANPTCLSAGQLASDARLSELWREARTGVETRRAFERQYSFRRTLNQEVVLYRRVGGRKVQKTARILLSDPDSVSVRDARNQARNRTAGYGSTMTITLPDEKEILNDDFLGAHCIESQTEEKDGAFGLSFRPSRTRGDFVDVRGQIWIDASSYQVRRLEVEYLRDGKQFASAAADYTDMMIEGKPLRLPASGTAYLDPSGIAGVVVKRATSKFNYVYDQVRAR